jgi:hypothetical protein
MAVADQTRVKKRLLEILNLADAGTYSTTLSARNKTHSTTAIDDAITEAGMTVLKTCAESPSSEYKSALISTVTITHGSQLPDHIGKVAFVEIQAYSGAPFRRAEQRPLARIEAYRENNSLIYDSIAHDTQGSTLSGYYDIWENKIYFTGNSCRIGIATVTRADTATKIPEVLENCWIGLSVEGCVKAGEGNVTLEVANFHGTRARQTLAEITGIVPKRVYREVSDPKPSSEIQS